MPEEKRKDYNGWRNLLRVYGSPAAILAVGVAWGQITYAAEEAKRERDDLKKANSEIVKIQRGQAQTNGKVLEALKVLTTQGRLTQDRLWEIHEKIKK